MAIGKQSKAAPPTDKAHPIACRPDQVPRVGKFDPVDSGRGEPLGAPQETGEVEYDVASHAPPSG